MTTCAPKESTSCYENITQGLGLVYGTQESIPKEGQFEESLVMSRCKLGDKGKGEVEVSPEE